MNELAQVKFNLLLFGGWLVATRFLEYIEGRLSRHNWSLYDTMVLSLGVGCLVTYFNQPQ